MSFLLILTSLIANCVFLMPLQNNDLQIKMQTGKPFWPPPTCVIFFVPCEDIYQFDCHFGSKADIAPRRFNIGFFTPQADTDRSLNAALPAGKTRPTPSIERGLLNLTILRVVRMLGLCNLLRARRGQAILPGRNRFDFRHRRNGRGNRESRARPQVSALW